MEFKLYNAEFKSKLLDFEKQLKQKGRSESIVTNYTTAVKELLWWMENNNILDVSIIDEVLLENYFQYLEHRPNKRRLGGLGNLHLQKCVDGIKRFVEKERNIEKGTSGIKIKYKGDSFNTTEILTKEQVKWMYDATEFDAYGLTDKAILAGLYGLGLRLNELHNCNEADISFSDQTLLVKHPKNGEEREVPMSPMVSQIMEEYLYEAKSLMVPLGEREPALIVSTRGYRLGRQRIEQRVTELAIKAEIDKHVVPHMLRHSIGTHLIGAGLSVFDVRDFLGHKSLDSTQIYIHLNAKQNG